MTPTPDSLQALACQLEVAAATVGRAAAALSATAAALPWTGEAADACAGELSRLRLALLRCQQRLLAAAELARRLAGRLAEELAAIRRAEQDVLGVLSGLARSLVHEATDDTRRIYDALRRDLPDPGSPAWTALAARLPGRRP